MTPEEISEREEQLGKPISFRAPPALARAIDELAGRELISTAAWCRRAVFRAVESAVQ